MPMKQIASLLGVSVGSVHLWTSDVDIGEEYRRRNARAGGEAGTRRWMEINRDRRVQYQEEGRTQARLADPFHEAGCMLYWAEGAKERGILNFTNSDRAMIAYFWRFVTRYFDVDVERVCIRLNVYLNNGLELDEIVEWWREVLPLARDRFRNHTVNHYPTSSSGRKRNRLPYGVCTIRLGDTRIVQHIYGAIQEYAGFEDPRWLHGRPRGQARSRRV
jgi:hypothetical protein